MSHFAHIDSNGVVDTVIVAEQDFIDTLPDKENWIQTSYNTIQGKHLLGGTPLRKNYAGIGYIYDPVLDAFIPPKIYDSWVLDPDIGSWVAPIPRPEDGKDYWWDEQNKQWLVIEIPI